MSVQMRTSGIQPSSETEVVTKPNMALLRSVRVDGSSDAATAPAPENVGGRVTKNKWGSVFQAGWLLPEDGAMGVWDPAGDKSQVLMHLQTFLSLCVASRGTDNPRSVRDGSVSLETFEADATFEQYVPLMQMLIPFFPDLDVDALPIDRALATLTLQDIWSFLIEVTVPDHVLSAFVRDLGEQNLWSTSKEGKIDPVLQLHSVANPSLSLMEPSVLEGRDEISVSPRDVFNNLIDDDNVPMRAASVLINLEAARSEKAITRSGTIIENLRPLDPDKDVGITIHLNDFEDRPIRRLPFGSDDVSIDGSRLTYKLASTRRPLFDPYALSRSIRRLPLCALVWTSTKVGGSVDDILVVNMGPDNVEWKGDVPGGLHLFVDVPEGAREVMVEVLYIDANVVSTDIVTRYRKKEKGVMGEGGFSIHAFRPIQVK